MNEQTFEDLYSDSRFLLKKYIYIYHPPMKDVMDKKKEILPELFHFQRHLFQNGMTKIQPRVSSSSLVLGSVIHDVVASRENGCFNKGMTSSPLWEVKIYSLSALKFRVGKDNIYKQGKFIRDWKLCFS